MTDELLTCPFCGGTTSSYGYPGHGGKEKYSCANQECPGFDIYATAEEWNTRTEDKRIEELERALRGMLIVSDPATQEWVVDMAVKNANAILNKDKEEEND